MWHDAVRPIILEFTMGRPRMYSGILFHNKAGDTFHPIHACAEPTGYRNYDTRRQFTEVTEDGDRRLRCTDFAIFWYLTDVHPGDGGLVVCPGRWVAAILRCARPLPRASCAQT